MRTALPGFAKTEAPLRALLTESLQHTTKTRRVAAKRVITPTEWTPALEEAWIAVNDLVRNRCLLYTSDAADE